MNKLTKFALLAAACFGVASNVAADSASTADEDYADCEILLMEVIKDKDVNGQTQVATYRAATDFIGSVFDDKIDPILDISGSPIRAVLCQRNDVIPTEKDYAPMSTGVAFILSQDFDSTDTDSLTMFWKEDKFQHVYKGHPLSEDSQAILDTRLEDFSERGVMARPEIKPEVEPTVDEEALVETVKSLDVESEWEAPNVDADAPISLNPKLPLIEDVPVENNKAAVEPIEIEEDNEDDTNE